MKVSEAIDTELRFKSGTQFDVNSPNPQDQYQRERLLFCLWQAVEEFWVKYPWEFRYVVGQALSVTSGSNSADAPSDISDVGHEGGLFYTTTQQRLRYMPPHELLRLRREASPGTGIPERYSVAGTDASTFLPEFIFERNASSTLSLTLDYRRRRPILVDRPAKVAAAVGAATGLTGIYKYKVGFVTVDGETLGLESATVTVSNQKISVSSIPLWPTFVPVTSRKLYRTVASGSVFKLVTTLSDNTTTTYTDSTADGSLGADAGTDYNGLDKVPDEYHRGVIMDGMRVYNLFDKGDGRSNGEARKQWLADLARAWSKRQFGQDDPRRTGDTGYRVHKMW